MELDVELRENLYYGKMAGLQKGAERQKAHEKQNK